MARICVVDDQPVMRESIAATLERVDHKVTTFADAATALEAMRRCRFDLVITDLKMPKMDGLALMRALREAKCETPVIVMTAYGTIPLAVEAMKSGAFDFVQKPFDAGSLELQVDRVLQHQRLRDENEALKTSLEDLREQRRMIGAGQAMSAIRTKIDQYAASEATVLISGESGTGKELAATAIHQASPRRDWPMLCVNCAALSASLLESELFGHERGAFTGADRLRRGRFELADGGTLLLDEISEMAPPLQAKLLRVLQEGMFERVGSSVTQRANVRIVATTNRVLEERVAKKRFREDLFYRLNVLPLHLPPLRQRPEDIDEMVTDFLGRMARRTGSKALTVDPAAMDALRAYGWPGNIRELENVCQRAVATHAGPVIHTADVEQWLGAARVEASGSDPFANLQPGRMLEDIERRLIERTLERFNGHRVKSAKALGMGVRTLGLKLKQWREQDQAVAATAQTEFQRAGSSSGILTAGA